jgi:hypothetical protein
VERGRKERNEKLTAGTELEERIDDSKVWSGERLGGFAAGNGRQGKASEGLRTVTGG